MFDLAHYHQVECRLSIGSKGLTNTKVNFQYFSVGDATKTVAFGPGLLHGTAPAVPVMFMIQARDKVILCCASGVCMHSGYPYRETMKATIVGKTTHHTALQCRIYLVVGHHLPILAILFP